MTSRESIFAALFTLLQTATGFNSSSRSIKDFADVAPADQPALFLQEGKQRAETRYRIPTKWTFYADIVLYVNSATPNQSADTVTVLNQQIDAVLAVLAPSKVTADVTLGNLVEDVRVNGDVDVYEGRLDAGGRQGIAVIPIEIIATV